MESTLIYSNLLQFEVALFSLTAFWKQSVMPVAAGDGILIDKLANDEEIVVFKATVFIAVIGPLAFTSGTDLKLSLMLASLKPFAPGAFN